MDSVCRVRTLVLHMEAHTNQVNLPSLLNNNNHPTTQARYSVAPARPDWPPVVSSGHLWPLSNSLSIYWHNHHLQKQRADLATCALEQTSQIVTNYHPAFLSRLIITLHPASVIDIMTSSHFVRGTRATRHRWQPHLHSVSRTRSQSLTLRLVFILARPTAHANKLTLTLSTGPHAQLDPSHLFDNRPHVAVTRSIWPIMHHTLRARSHSFAFVFTHLHSVYCTHCTLRAHYHHHPFSTRMLSHSFSPRCHAVEGGEGWIKFCWCLVVLVIFFVISFNSSPCFLPICLHSPVTFGYPVIPPVVLF